MNILYVYAHPNPESFNAKLKQSGISTLKATGATVKTSDLYAMQFKAAADNNDFTNTNNNQQYFIAQHDAFNNSTLTNDISAEIAKIQWADHIIFQFPLWWFAAPAILKGWFDRTFIKGFAYDANHMFDQGLLKNKTASFTVTTQSPETAYQKNGSHGHGMDEFLLPLTHTLRFAGIEVSAPFVVYGAFNLGSGEVSNIESNYAEYLEKIIQGE